MAHETLSIDWPKRRLAHAARLASTHDDAAAWRYLRNLAAAYGEREIALDAHRRLSGQTSGVAILRVEIRSLTPKARAAWVKAWCARNGLSASESDGAMRIEAALTADALWKKMGSNPEIVVS